MSSAADEHRQQAPRQIRCAVLTVSDTRTVETDVGGRTVCELLAEVEALRQLAYHCTRMLVANEDMTKEVSMAKLKAGRLAREVADTCLQFHGGMGYVEEYPMARYFRDARLLSIGAGADEVMLGVIAKYEGILTR